MATTASTSSTSGTTGASQALLDAMNGAKTKKSVAEEAQDRFMTLLVTQMKNQDPLNPLDNAQVTSQLAQLSTVSGIDKLNDTLASMMTNAKTSESYQAAALIGRGIMTAGSNVTLQDSTALMGVELKDAADRVSVNVTDTNGNVVRTLELGAKSAGIIPLAWDGKNNAGTVVADGKYKFEVSATKNGTKVGANTMSVESVNSVSTSKDGVKLNLTNGKSVTMADVAQII